MADVSAEEQPIFVGGADRSGTSLMFALLASHSRISMVRRTNMWRWFYGKFGDLADASNLQSALSSLSRYTRLRHLNPDWERIGREFATGPASYGRLFSLLHTHHAEAVGKARWGDKSLHTEYFARDVFTEFPAAKIIHLIRDPRDRYASISRRYEDRSKGIGAVTGRWRASVRAADRNQRKYRSRYMVVRFEDLAADPAGVMMETCSFVGEEFEPKMLAMEGAPEHQRGNSSFGDIKPATISTAPIGRFRDTMSSYDIAFIQRAVGRSMTAHGYELDTIDFSPGDRFRFAVATMPTSLARMNAWLLRERMNRTKQTVPAQRLAGVGADG